MWSLESGVWSFLSGWFVRKREKFCHPERSVAESKDLGTSLLRTDLSVRRSFDSLALAQDDTYRTFARLTRHGSIFDMDARKGSNAGGV